MSSPPNLVTIPVVINDITVAYSIPVINETAINITWTCPTNSNGLISSFNVKISTHAIGFVISVNANEKPYTIIYGGLSMLL